MEICLLQDKIENVVKHHDYCVVDRRFAFVHVSDVLQSMEEKNIV